ncbi:hypothetical protein [Streptomyces sp. NPDC017260]|uniref:hypothetical protein n=1 Tax=unclassified Streptomyces TaxID=2593676 RepID=UPI0037B99F9C
MAGEYGIQHFHPAGSWQALGAYQHMGLDKAMTQATEFAENTYAFPLGLRVTGPKQWASDRIGGRSEITLIHNPITGIWTAGCAKCPRTEESTDVYAATGFTRNHKC